MMEEAPKNVPENAERVIEEKIRVWRLKEGEETVMAAETTAARREQRSWRSSTEWRFSGTGWHRGPLGGGLLLEEGKEVRVRNQTV
jgi:hypothetical protein